jgi:hypothetical protein
MTKRVFIRRNVILGLILGVLLAAVSCCVLFSILGIGFSWKYHYRIKIGLTLAEVENTLGPGEERKGPPHTPDGSVIQGDVFYVWQDDPIGGGSAIWLGFREGNVCDKWLWEPSL